MNSVLLLLSASVALVAGYATGPPVDSIADLCKDMVPTGHGADAQTSDAPYSYVFSSQCYKAGMEIKVAIKSTSDNATLKYFEGYFTQVQKTDVKDVSYGTFATEDTEYSKTIKCFDTDNIAVSHAKHSHFDTRVFTWTAPATGQDDLVFRSTIVKGKTTFWVNVYSDPITYNADCAAGDFTETNTVQEGYEGSSEESSDDKDTSDATPILPGILTALATLVFALLL